NGQGCTSKDGGGTMKSEVWSDIVCPWCYIGKRRMEPALREAEIDAEVHWRSFELDPSAPRHIDRPLAEQLARKYRMGIEQARAMMANVAQNAAEEGLEFDFERARPGNTFDAHRLLHLAHEAGKGGAMKERLLRAYFSEGAAVADRAVMADLAAEVGLDWEQVVAALESNAYADGVRADRETAWSMGVQGVPLFVIDGEVGIPGAQPVATLVKVLQQLQTVSEPGEQCDDEVCAP